jgi:cysteine desulfurase
VTTLALEEQPICLDYNAATPLLPEVVEAMLPYLREHFGNPSSAHAYGRRAREAVEAARAEVAALLECDAQEIVFTSGGTEASNLAIRGVAEACPERRHVVTSTIEHPATEQTCAWLQDHGWRVTRAGVDAGGRVSIEDVQVAVSRDTALVTIMHANNETGVVQPIAELAKVAHAAGALIHCDAAQSVGKIAVRVDDLGVDLLSLAGLKVYAPKGVGALFVRQGTRLVPFTRGAGHERGLRPGTENVASIVGLGVACRRAKRDLDTEAARVEQLRDRLWGTLLAAVPGLERNGHAAPRLPNTLNVRFPGVWGSDLLAATPEVAASAGAACHDGQAQASAVILAMGVPPLEALGSVRLSLGRNTTRAEVDKAAEALARGWRASKERESQVRLVAQRP